MGSVLGGIMYLKFNNVEEFNAWHDQVNNHFGYPNEDIKTYRYTDAISNEANDNVICCYDEQLPAQFLEGQTQITKEQAIEQGFLPIEELTEEF